MPSSTPLACSNLTQAPAGGGLVAAWVIDSAKNIQYRIRSGIVICNTSPLVFLTGSEALLQTLAKAGNRPEHALKCPARTLDTDNFLVSIQYVSSKY